MLVKFRLFILQAFFKKFGDFFYFLLLEHVQTINKGITKDDIAETTERVINVHSDKQNPCNVAHTLDVFDVGPINLKHFQQFFDFFDYLFTFFFIQFDVHST